jgi:heme exporter protein C
MSPQTHNAVGWMLVIVTLGLIGFWVPAADRMIGESYLIFFFHFPSALSCLCFFVFAGVVALVYLLRGARHPQLDARSAAAVEVGLLACTITLVTGSIWAKAAWGIWWDFGDPRLMSVAIMWFTYAGYIALRSALEDPARRSLFCAVFAIVAAINVPIVWFSIRVLTPVAHPRMVTMSEPSMIFTRWFGVLAFLVVYSALWRQRSSLLRLRHQLATLEDTLNRRRI